MQNYQQIGNLIQGGGGQVPAGIGYNPGMGAIVMPEVLREVQIQQLGRNQQPLDLQQLQQRAARFSQQEQGKKIMTNILTNLAGQGSGRGVPQYNVHEQQGRSGLVDPQLTGQQTTLPIPFNRQWDLAANLQAYVNSLPSQTYQLNEQIKQSVDQQIPQAQTALRQPTTIYQKTPESFVVNRLNLALQRKREQSIYAVV